MIGKVVPQALDMIGPLAAIVLVQPDPTLHVVVLHQMVKARGDVCVGIRNVSHHTSGPIKPVNLRQRRAKSVQINVT